MRNNTLVENVAVLMQRFKTKATSFIIQLYLDNNWYNVTLVVYLWPWNASYLFYLYTCRMAHACNWSVLHVSVSFRSINMSITMLAYYSYKMVLIYHHISISAAIRLQCFLVMHVTLTWPVYGLRACYWI